MVDAGGALACDLAAKLSRSVLRRSEMLSMIGLSAAQCMLRHGDDAQHAGRLTLYGPYDFPPFSLLS